MDLAISSGGPWATLHDGASPIVASVAPLLHLLGEALGYRSGCRHV